MKKNVKVVGNVILSTILAGSLIPVSVFAQEDEHPTEKTETVYAVLNQDGSVSDVTVSSWLHDEDGINGISETLDETNVENVKSDEEPTVQGNTYTWNSDGNDIYYQGTTDKELPISVHITYELDGQELSAQEVAGKSGHLKMRVNFTNTISKVISVNGRSVTVHPSYVGGGMLALDTDHYKNVSCENGKIVNDGTNEILAFANVPGLAQTFREAGLDSVNDKLNISDDTIIEADVTDFDLGSIMIAMSNEMSLNEITNELSLGDLTSGITQIVSASDQLLAGSKELYDGTVELNTSAKPLTSAYPQIEELAQATTILHQGTSTLYQGIQNYTQGVNALNEGNKQLYAISDGVGQTYGGANTLLSGAQSLQAGIEQIQEKTSSLNDSSIKELSAMLENSQNALSSMEALLSKDQAILNSMESTLMELNNSLESLGNAKVAYDQAVASYNEAVVQNNEIVDRNNAILSQYSDDIAQANQQLQIAANNANADIDRAIAALQAAAASTEDVTTRAQIEAQISNLQASKVEAYSIQNNSDDLEKLNTIDTTQIDMILAGITDGVGTLSNTLSSAQSTLDTLSDDIQTSQTTLTQMQSALEQANTSIPGGIDETIVALKTGINELEKGSQSLVTGCVALNAGLEQLATESKSGIDQINAGSSQLVENNETLVLGAGQLDDGAAQLEAQKSTFNEMSEGLQELQSAFDSLQEGASQLYEGQEQFNQEGMGQLQELANLTSGEMEMVQTILNEVEQLNEENKSFAGAPEGASTITRFVFRTREMTDTEE